MLRRSTLAFFLAVLLLPISGWAQQIEATDGGVTAIIDTSFSVDPGGTLDLQARNGSITVTGGDRSEVVVRERIRLEDGSRDDMNEYLTDHATTYEVTNGTVRVRGPENGGGGGWWWGGSEDDVEYNYEVQVPRRFSASLQTSGGSLTVSSLEGTVNGQTAGGSVTTEDITGDVQVQTAGGSLTLSNIDGKVQGKTAGGSVEVRETTGPVNVKTAGGSIRVDDAGGNVSAQTAGGSIRAIGVKGRLMGETAGGDITARAVTQETNVKTAGGTIELEDIGGRVTAETSGGDIIGEGLHVAVDAKTSAGDIELRDVQAQIKAKTSVGDILVESTAESYAANPALQLTTSHGDIDLRLRSGLEASIHAEVRGAGGDDIRSDVPLTREGGDGEPLRATGDMNGGGPTIELETNGGSIRVRTDGS